MILIFETGNAAISTTVTMANTTISEMTPFKRGFIAFLHSENRLPPLWAFANEKPLQNNNTIIFIKKSEWTEGDLNPPN